jgi:hypothetical protein
MKLLLITFGFFAGIVTHAQDVRVDSVFNLYFNALEFEADYSFAKSHPELLDCSIDEKTNEKICLSKYGYVALTFIQEISGIKAQYDKDFHFVRSQIIDREIIDKWKDWYKANTSNIIWSNEKSRPVLRSHTKKITNSEL